MNELEIDKLCEQLGELSSYELTNVAYNEKVLQFSLSSSKDFFWFTVSLKPGQPYAFLGGPKTRRIKGEKKPLALFFKTHFMGQALRCCHRLKNKGRVIFFEFAKDLQIEICLFPGGQNIELRAFGKILYALKPKNLENNTDQNYVPDNIRDNDFFIEYWQNLNQQKSQDRGSPVLVNKVLDKAINKKKNGLAKMLEKMMDAENNLWGLAGEFLKQNQSLDEVPGKFQKYIDLQKDFSWNLENCFKKQKKEKLKKEGTLERIEVLKQEIFQMEKEGLVESKKPVTKSLLKVSEAKGRTHSLAEGLNLYVGKSAKDNLALIRRAKPWYLWMHIRDYPGAYGIIERPRKGKDLNSDILEKAGQYVVSQSVPGDHKGTFEVIIAECRYVRPIKGAKPGQVTYSHEKVITIKV